MIILPASSSIHSHVSARRILGVETEHTYTMVSVFTLGRSEELTPWLCLRTIGCQKQQPTSPHGSTSKLPMFPPMPLLSQQPSSRNGWQCSNAFQNRPRPP